MMNHLSDDFFHSMFSRNSDAIRGKRVFTEKTDIRGDGFDWNNIIDMVDSHPRRLHDWNREKQRIALNSFHLRGSAPKFSKHIMNAMRKFFVDEHRDFLSRKKYKKGPQQITNIAFIGFGQCSGSYPRHKDGMDVFLVQVVNPCRLTAGPSEKPDPATDVSFDMVPGSMVWIPRGTWHRLEPAVSRVTFSFGVEGDFDPADYV